MEDQSEPLAPELVDERLIRISDSDRKRVIDHLQVATRDGRLDLDEFQERAKLAYAARYETDLAPLTADLPAFTTEASVSATKPKRRWLLSVMGGAERRGRWDPGDHTIAISIMGGQDLDLTQVVATEVSITAFTLMGGTEIIVPKGATVDLSGFIVMGATENSTQGPGDSPMRVRIRSYGAMGGLEVRHLKPKEEAKRRAQDG